MNPNESDAPDEPQAGATLLFCSPPGGRMVIALTSGGVVPDMGIPPDAKLRKKKGPRRSATPEATSGKS
jgi:hypothetical protein